MKTTEKTKRQKTFRTREESKKIFFNYLAWIYLNRNKKFTAEELRDEAAKRKMSLAAPSNLRNIDLILKTGINQYEFNEELFNKLDSEKIYSKYQTYIRDRFNELNTKKKSENTKTELNLYDMNMVLLMRIESKLNKLLEFINIDFNETKNTNG